LGAVIAICIIIVVAVYLDTPRWSEWQMVSKEITCGSGVQVYERKCNISTVAKQFGRMCVGEDTKTEEIVLEPCAVVTANGDTISAVQSPPASQEVQVATTAPAVAAEPTVTWIPVKGRYVVLEKKNSKLLNIKDLIVYGKGGKVLTQGDGVTAKASSVYNGNQNVYGPNNLIDQDYTTLARSGANDQNPYFRIDLGRDEIITKIAIKNREDAIKPKIQNAVVRIVTDKWKTVWQAKITTVKSMYNFKVPWTKKVVGE